MTNAKQGDTVVIDYTVRTGDGRVVGGTEQAGPQTLTLGKAEIFPAIEAALEGMEVGAEKAVTIESANAFGPRREEMVVQLPRDQLPQDQPPQPGMTLSAKQQDGTTVNLVITEVGEKNITADGNHPLAGEDLHFGLTLVEIKEAA
ncbi:FKBP-type peptidyl-prolyl cis-trans isomerase [Hyphococcus sp.]|uniref:FKBP-type peptidyl-prolyl cis-trans isomerase n=1 Tax=Hyphococcus sp. TaxID=2038636 RepID=UPI003CCBC34F